MNRPHRPHAPRARTSPPIAESAFERAAAIFRAAGDVPRLKILERLCDGEWCVSELAEASESGMSTVSQQLRLLRADLLVTRRREGTHVYYALADDHVRDLIRTVLSHASEGNEGEPHGTRHPRKARARAR